MKPKNIKYNFLPIGFRFFYFSKETTGKVVYRVDMYLAEDKKSTLLSVG